MPAHFVLSKATVIAIHQKLNVELGGFTSESNLDFIFEMINDFPENAGINPKSDEEKVVYLASYLLFHLVKGHCFNDGNKRTAFLSFGAQLLDNGIESLYEEKYISQKLDAINQKVNAGKKPPLAIHQIFSRDSKNAEYQLILLLFELAGANPQKEYNSPLDIYPITSQLIKWKTKNILEDRTMTTQQTMTKKSRFKAIPSDPKRVMKIVDELIRKNPRTLELLGK